MNHLNWSSESAVFLHGSKNQFLSVPDPSDFVLYLQKEAHTSCALSKMDERFVSLKLQRSNESKSTFAKSSCCCHNGLVQPIKTSRFLSHLRRLTIINNPMMWRCYWLFWLPHYIMLQRIRYRKSVHFSFQINTAGLFTVRLLDKTEPNKSELESYWSRSLVGVAENGKSFR